MSAIVARSEEAAAELSPAPSGAGSAALRRYASGEWYSGDGPLEGHQHTLGATGADPALDLDGGDGLDLPALPGVLVEHTLELARGHLAADEPFANLDDLVLVPHGRRL